MSQVILRKHITRYELLQNNYNQTYDLKLFEDNQLIPTFKNESEDLFNTVFDTFCLILDLFFCSVAIVDGILGQLSQLKICE